MIDIKKIIFSMLVITSLIFSSMAFGVQEVAAAKDDEKVNIDNGDRIQQRITANNRVRFRFEEETKVTFEANKPANVSIKCDAEKIGEKDFEIEVDADESFNMTMKCKEEEYEKGLLKGNTVQARNRNRYRYQEGFVADIESSEDCEAKLRMQANDENRGGTWAYYDEGDEEWVTVETTEKDGYLECETDHFSTWTILVPEIDYIILIIVGISIAAVILIGVALLILKRRK